MRNVFWGWHNEPINANFMDGGVPLGMVVPDKLVVPKYAVFFNDRVCKIGYVSRR